jgi:soluble lytic murein transglycosylase-like protein
MRDQLRRSHHDWSEAELLRGAVAAYNTGASRVRSASGMDRYTTGRDYSSDVWIRAQHYASLFSDTLPGA